MVTTTVFEHFGHKVSRIFFGVLFIPFAVANIKSFFTFSAALVGIGISIRYGHSDNLPALSGRAFASLLFVALEIFLIVSIYKLFTPPYARKRRTASNLVKACLIILLGSVVLMGFAAYKNGYKPPEDVRKVLSEYLDNTDRVREQMLDSDGYAKKVRAPAIQTSSLDGELGVLQRFMNDILRQRVAFHNDYLTALENVNFFELLEPARLGNDRQLQQSLVILEQAKLVIAQYERREAEFIGSIPDQVAELSIKEASKRAFLREYNSGMRQTHDKRQQLWALEKAILKEFEAIIDLLRNKPAAWVIEVDQISFYEDDTLADYNARLEAVERLGAQQTAIEQQLHQSKRAELEKLLD